MLKTPSPAPQNGDMLFGTAVHIGLDSYLSGLNGSSVFSRFWQTWQGGEVEYGRYDWSALLGQGQVLLERFHKKYQPKITVFEKEQRLYGQHGDLRIEGTPDVLGDYEGVPSVIDFKTSGTRYPKGRAGISEQLYMYAHLAKTTRQYEAKQLVFLVLMKGTNPYIQEQITPFDEDEQARVLGDFHSQADFLEGLETFPRYRQQCLSGNRACEFFPQCFPKLIGG